MATDEYLAKLPITIPEGRVLVHNNVRPARRLGTRGFRAWLSVPDASRLEPCVCGWAPELGRHFRMRGADPALPGPRRVRIPVTTHEAVVPMTVYVHATKVTGEHSPAPSEGLSAEQLIERLQGYGFECEGGPLRNCVEWMQLKAAIREE